MTLNNLPINDSFWDFIEANVPDYSKRDDVSRQSELQLFIDGHESSVQGITRQEAVLLRDNILHGLFAEAIQSFTARTPLVTPGNVSLRYYAETLADIAFQAGAKRFRPTGNSRDAISTVIEWADEFSRLHKDTDWNTAEYLDEIEKFTEKKLNQTPCEDNPKAEFDIAFLNRDTLESYGYCTDDLSDNDLQVLAGMMGDSYCNSSQFDFDLETACNDFGLEQIE